jgi:hypothetical protein
MPNLVPAGNGGALTNWLSKAKGALVKSPQNDVQPVQDKPASNVPVPMPDGTKWSIQDLSRYIHANNGKLPPHLQPRADGTGDTYHITIAPPPPTTHPGVQITLGVLKVLGVTIETFGRVLVFVLQTIFHQQKRKQPPPQPQIVHVQHPLSETLNHFIAHMMMFGVFLTVFFILFLFILMMSGPHWSWWDYPPAYHHYRW